MTEKNNIQCFLEWNDEAYKWVCAFANSNGGKIYLGVNTDNEIIGIEDINTQYHLINNNIFEKLNVRIDMRILNSSNIDYIEVSVKQFSILLTYEGIAYKIQDDELIALNYEDALKENFKNDYLNDTVENININEINQNHINSFCNNVRLKIFNKKHEVLDNEQILKKLSYMTENNQLKLATTLLFSKEPHKYISGAYIRITDCTNEKKNKNNSYNLYGSLIELIESTPNFIFNLIKSNTSFKKANSISIAVITELIINALSHKKYTDSTPIEIKIYKDNIEFCNPYVNRQADTNLFNEVIDTSTNHMIETALFWLNIKKCKHTGLYNTSKVNFENKLLPLVVELDTQYKVKYFSVVNAQLDFLNVNEEYHQLVEHTLKSGTINKKEVQSMLGANTVKSNAIMRKLSHIFQFVESYKNSYYILNSNIIYISE